jgi:imidazolonepropionase-like amidohydrolase
LDERQHPVTRELAINLLRIEHVFAQAGVHYLIGGSTHYRQLPGRSVHTEMKMLERIGLTRRQALAAATTNFASVFGFKEVGTLRPGSRGDVVVLDADPLVDISNTLKIHSVYIGGRAVDRESILKGRDDR